jgi:hypothetical protein
MNGKIFALITALALAAGCEFAEKTDVETSGPTCVSTGGACTENRDCCSYGCVGGQCVANPLDGGACRTTNDCLAMLCKSEHCSSTATCRDDADVCTTAAQCCSSHCDGTHCVPNKAPVIQMGAAVQTVPRNQPFPIVNTSYDPDGDAVSWGWTLTAVLPPTAPGTLSATNVKNPTFNPGSTLATYTLALDATDVWGLGASGTVTLNVVNTAPVVSAAATATTPRNQALNVPMTVSDANGDTLSCSWTICRPDSATTCLTAPPLVTGIAGLPASVRTAVFQSGAAVGNEGPWDVTLTCTDGFLSSSGKTTVTVTNSAPVIGVPSTRTYNLDFVAASTPEKTITAVPSDVNGDPVVSWSWSISPATGASLTSGTTAAVVGFTPTAGGAYTLTVTACDGPASNPPYVDRAGACGSATVVASVYPYIRPLTSGTGSVVDASWRKSDDRLVAIGSDSGGSGRLWLANPAVDPGTTADAAVALGAIPIALSINSDGSDALVGESTSRWQTVSLGTSPAASTLYTAPFVPTGVVHHGNRGFVLNGAMSPSIYQLNLGTGGSTLVNCTIATGGTCTPVADRAVSNGTEMWLLDAGTNLARYSVNNGNGDLTRETALVAVSAAASDVWRASDPSYLFLPGDGVKVASTLAYAGNLPAGTTHADSSLTAGSLVGLAATGGNVTPFNSSFVAGAPIALPHWGATGTDRTLTARWVFRSQDGTRAHVVVLSGTPAEWGLYSCTLPCTLP